MKKFIFALGAAVLLIWSEPTRGQSVKGRKANAVILRPRFQVDSYKWTSQVDGPKAIGEIKEGRLRQPVYLWIMLSGDKDALDLMKDVDHPVSFKWFRNANYGLTPESSDIVFSDEPEFSQTVGIGRLQWIDRKRQEMKKENRFTFSVWSGLTAFKKPGEYVVKLVYYDNLPVDCNGSPCEFKITIR